jgi:hypothetical protein
MKIKELIQRLKYIEKKQGNIEVLIADRIVSSNYMRNEVAEISFFDTYDNDENNALLLGVEESEGTDEIEEPEDF